MLMSAKKTAKQLSFFSFIVIFASCFLCLVFVCFDKGLAFPWPAWNLLVDYADLGHMAALLPKSSEC